MEISHDSVVMGFAASCVEHVARKLSLTYKDVYAALKRTNAFNDYIIPHYDVLHTQSREWVNDEIIDYLKRRGEFL